jgi:hypothetical protein
MGTPGGRIGVGFADGGTAVVCEGLRREQYRRGRRYHDEVLMARPLIGGQ